MPFPGLDPQLYGGKEAGEVLGLPNFIQNVEEYDLGIVSDQISRRFLSPSRYMTSTLP